MRKKARETNVKVRLRQGIDLADLENWHQKLNVDCGAGGVSIARQVREGGGVVSIKLAQLPSAIDTHDGLNILNTLFEFEDPRSLSPLLYQLIRERER
ncbi:hypothetical protein [Salinisphaera sp. C84B14]|uniref:hypothetical protein n=1 Tax=Salinisphaera sp. C84B14 TaxID=1304155 RepID=UPI003341BFF5